MSKFVVVRKVPANLDKGEVVINSPDFMEQIQANWGRRPRQLHTTINFLRDILNSIQQKYQTDLDIFRVPLSKYEGLAYTDEKDLSKIIVNLLQKERPAVFETALEYNIKHRPYGTKLVYYTGDLSDTTPFFRNGVDMIEEKDVDEHLGRKPKKIVGKPAITKEEAESKQNN